MKKLVLQHEEGRKNNRQSRNVHVEKIDHNRILLKGRENGRDIVL